MKLSLRPRTQPEVNLTSLIDVVFLLLIFFLVTTTFKETPRTDQENKNLLDLSLRGLQLLSEWTSVVTELYSWKLLHPTDHHQNKDCPQVKETALSS